MTHFVKMGHIYCPFPVEYSSHTFCTVYLHFTMRTSSRNSKCRLHGQTDNLQQTEQHTTGRGHYHPKLPVPISPKGDLTTKEITRVRGRQIRSEVEGDVGVDLHIGGRCVLFLRVVTVALLVLVSQLRTATSSAASLG